MKKKILVTGANGQVGNELQFLASQSPNFEFIFTNRDTLDIGNLEDIEAFFHEHLPHYCINCAAYTAVDKAESEVDLAYAINAQAVQFLAMNCHLQQVPLIHLSTDYVYHSEQNTPFVEENDTNPQGVYAASKLEGDLAALEVHHLTMVIRTSWVYSSYGNNFVKTMLRLGKERPALNVVFDQIGSPTYARDLAEAILSIIQKIENQEVKIENCCGIFHYSNEGVTSWYDFAKAIFDLKKINCEVNPIETIQFPTPASRPPFSLMNKRKIKDTFGVKIPYWRESLEKMLDLI